MFACLDPDPSSSRSSRSRLRMNGLVSTHPECSNCGRPNPSVPPQLSCGPRKSIVECPDCAGRTGGTGGIPEDAPSPSSSDVQEASPEVGVKRSSASPPSSASAAPESFSSVKNPFGGVESIHFRSVEFHPPEDWAEHQAWVRSYRQRSSRKRLRIQSKQQQQQRHGLNGIEIIDIRSDTDSDSSAGERREMKRDDSVETDDDDDDDDDDESDTGQENGTSPLQKPLKETGYQDFRIPKSIIREGRKWATSHPPPYRKITTNQYPPDGPVRRPVQQSIRDAWKCECEYICDVETCQNALLNVECRKGVCGAKICHNRRLQLRQYAKTKVFHTGARGWGLKCVEDVKAGSLITEYVGEVIDNDTCNRRLESAKKQGIRDFYMFKVNATMTIDAGPMGNTARFVNHSCEPNCNSEKWDVGNQVRVGIFAMQDIPAGTELTYNYNFMGDWEPGQALSCLCGTPSCSGFLGSSSSSKRRKQRRTLNGRKEQRKQSDRTSDSKMKSRKQSSSRQSRKSRPGRKASPIKEKKDRKIIIDNDE